jgi:hypothetical protein
MRDQAFPPELPSLFLCVDSFSFFLFPTPPIAKRIEVKPLSRKEMTAPQGVFCDFLYKIAP